MDCNIQCEFYTDSLQRWGACVQIHQPETGIHFFSILTLGKVAPSQTDKSNQWYVGLNELIKDE